MYKFLISGLTSFPWNKYVTNRISVSAIHILLTLDHFSGKLFISINSIQSHHIECIRKNATIFSRLTDMWKGLFRRHKVSSTCFLLLFLFKETKKKQTKWNRIGVLFKSSKVGILFLISVNSWYHYNKLYPMDSALFKQLKLWTSGCHIWKGLTICFNFIRMKCFTSIVQNTLSLRI